MAVRAFNSLWITSVRTRVGIAVLTAGLLSASAADAQIAVACALPHTRGQQGADCNGKHTIVISTTGTTPSAQVTAELLALDANGNLIRALPVAHGDAVHMASRVDPRDFKLTTKKKSHEIFAPIPLLKVTVSDQGQTAEAYCSNIPYLDVVEPNGTVVTESAGNDTQVLVAIPRTDPDSVELRVDNVDLFEALGIMLPSSCTEVTPCGGVADIHGHPVQVSNLIVDGSSNIGTAASNTVRATLSDLSCGTHLFNVSASQAADALRNPTSAACVVDDLTDTGTSSVFAIDIESPTANAVVPAGSVLVKGEVCGGNPIVNAKVNGLNLDLTGQVFQPGNGLDMGQVYRLPIHATLGETDVVRDITSGDAAVGTFDAGSNRLAASATDTLGNRAFARRIFATGDVAPIGVEQALSATFQQNKFVDTVNTGLKTLLAPEVSTAMSGTSSAIENAFVVGLSAAGTQKLFDQLCTAPVNAPDNPAINGKTPGQLFSEKVEAAILAIGPKSISPSVPCASDPNVALTITNVDVGTNVTCNVDFNDGSFHVTLGLPDVHVDVRAFGTGGDWGDDVCVEGVKVEGTAFADVTNIKLEFDVTEGNLLNASTSTPVFDAGTTVKSNGTVGVDFCGLSVVCNVVVTIFTFGAVDINPEINFDKVQDFSAQVGASQPDPVRLKEIKVDEQVVANFDQQLSADVSSVRITEQGIVAGLTGHFGTTLVDPDVPSTPGSVLTPAPLPNLPVPNAQDVFIGLADDSINMMFASMAAAGKLKLGCVDTTKTIGDLLPDCDTLTLETDAATAAARGMCYGVRGNVCESFSFGNAALTATGQGICHGAQGATCSQIPTTFGTALVEKAACNVTPDFNLEASQSLLFCTQQDIPPRMLFPGDDTLTSSVPATLRLNDLSVALIVDRDGTPGFPPPSGVLADAQGCFKNGANTAADCNLLAACLDINLNFDVGFRTCADGKPGFRSTFNTIQLLNREVGMVCGGSGAPTNDAVVLNTTSTDDTVTIQIGQQAGDLSPDICGAGMDLGGFVTCQSPQLLAIEADGSAALKDYLAITCKVQ
jgi:hypothetical protein